MKYIVQVRKPTGELLYERAVDPALQGSNAEKTRHEVPYDTDD